MKKFFYIIISLFFVTNASAQVTDQQKQFIIQTFPGYMPEHVLQNAEVVAVDKKYAKKHDGKYDHDNLQGAIYQGTLRIGDTVLVFNNRAFYSKGQNVFMRPSLEQKTAKAPKVQKSPEQRAQNAETLSKILQTGAGILNRSAGGGLSNNSSNSTVRW